MLSGMESNFLYVPDVMLQGIAKSTFGRNQLLVVYTVWVQSIYFSIVLYSKGNQTHDVIVAIDEPHIIAIVTGSRLSLLWYSTPRALEGQLDYHIWLMDSPVML